MQEAEVDAVIDSVPPKPLEITPDSLPAIPEDARAMKVRTGLHAITVEKLQVFLSELEKTGLLYGSARKAGLAYQTINRLAKEDPDFKAWIDEAMEFYKESLQNAAHSRAVDGWLEPVFSHKTGAQMGEVQRFDSRLLELLLKRHIPEFREKFEGEIKVSGGVLIAPLMPQSPDDWEKKFGGDNQIRLLSPETGGTTVQQDPAALPSPGDQDNVG